MSQAEEKTLLDWHCNQPEVFKICVASIVSTWPMRLRNHGYTTKTSTVNIRDAAPSPIFFFFWLLKHSPKTKMDEASVGTYSSGFDLFGINLRGFLPPRIPHPDRLQLPTVTTCLITQLLLSSIPCLSSSLLHH